MKFRLSINAKNLVLILTTSILIFLIVVGSIIYNTRKLAISDAEKLAIKTAQESAIKIEKEFSEELAVLRTLAQAFSVYDEMEEQEWKELFLKMYTKVYVKNKGLYKLWDSWEIKDFDPNWTSNSGRYSVTIYRQNNQVLQSVDILGVDGDNPTYANIKSVCKDMIWEPYWDEIIEDGEERKFMTSISSPIFKNNKFAGIVAADIIIERFQEIINQISNNESNIAFITSNQGIFAGHSDHTLIGQSLAQNYPEYENQLKLSECIKEGKTTSFRGHDKNNNKVLIVTVPIQVGEYKAPWALTLIVPYKAILADANKALLISIIVALLGIALLTFVILLIIRKLTHALGKTTGIIEKLSRGDLENIEDLIISRGDEFEKIEESLNALKNGLIKTSEFAAHIGNGNLDVNFNLLSDKDVLGNSLLEMRESLKHAKEEEQRRKIIDEKQNWTTHGLAKFGEILRTNSTNIKELSFNIMSNLVKYLEINQGALFIVEDSNEGEPFLEIKSAIAYGRDKYLKKSIRIGEELVGRCAFEKATIYMTDIPKDYIKITSGLGTANPSSLLLVPLILNDEIFGVIELASFNEIQDYQIQFVERLGESIASTIATVKVNEKTSRLLGQSKSQAEELAAQEEETRQNLEELQATQEEAARREYELSGIVKAIGTAAFTVEYDLEGVILSCNEKYAEMLGMPAQNLVGKNHADGYNFTAEKKANYDLFWGDLSRGISKKEINSVKFNNREFWVEEIYTPIIAQNEKIPYKILKIGFDITDQKLKEIKMQEQEIKIKKERLLLGEYQGRMAELQDKLKEAQTKIIDLETKKPNPAKIISHPGQDVKSTNNNLIDWTPKLAMGIDEMDEQHKQLIDLINSMHESFKQEKNKKEIKENIRSFVDFASYHFGNEEHYFKQFNYAESEPHILEHHKFLKEIKQFQDDYNSNKVLNANVFLATIKEWLFNHFATHDFKYKEAFKLNGL